MRLRALAIAITATACMLAACGDSGLPAPPKPLAAPTRIDDVTGIWRSAHQNVLEMRRAGTFVLITPITDAMAGNYALDQGKITFFDTKACGAAQGTYRIQVAAKDRMQFSEPDDSCAPRRTALADPYVYSQPDFS